VELISLSAIALIIVVPFRLFIAQPFVVSGTSMEPTFEPKEYLVIDEISYRFKDIERGDVVIFRYPLDPDVYFVKRIIGLPGDTITIRDGVVSISRDGEAVYERLDEPYVRPGFEKKDNSSTILDEREYFVLGDNRRASADSRVWGPLQDRYIIGRAVARLYPLSDATLFPGHHTFTQ
jgi:signal peptidase I